MSNTEVINDKFKDLFVRMDEEEKQAQIDYPRIMEEDKDKTYMDLLPTEFRNKKNLLITDVLEYIDRTTEFLNNCSLYDGRKFDKKEVVRYMMRGTDYSNFYLARLFLPRKDSSDIWGSYCSKWYKENPEKKLPEGLYGVFAEENKEILKVYQDLETNLYWLIDGWKRYKNRKEVKDETYSRDIEKDGFPRTGRGNLCYSFVPVKGGLPKNKKGELNLINPRNKKNVTYKILEYKPEDGVYKCLDEKGKTVFLIDHEIVAEAWDCLHDVNKEIFSGWWNRTLILKK